MTEDTAPPEALATEQAREAAALDLYITFEKKHSDHFTAQLYRLIAKGDGGNRRRLERAFPLHVAMYVEWMLTPDRHTFYEKYNCVKNYRDDDAGLMNPEAGHEHKQGRLPSDES